MNCSCTVITLDILQFQHSLYCVFHWYLIWTHEWWIVTHKVRKQARSCHIIFIQLCFFSFYFIIFLSRRCLQIFSMTLKQLKSLMCSHICLPIANLREYIHSLTCIIQQAENRTVYIWAKTHHSFLNDNLASFYKPKYADNITSSLKNAFFCIQSLTAIRSQTSKHAKPEWNFNHQFYTSM